MVRNKKLKEGKNKLCLKKKNPPAIHSISLFFFLLNLQKKINRKNERNHR